MGDAADGKTCGILHCRCFGRCRLDWVVSQQEERERPPWRGKNPPLKPDWCVDAAGGEGKNRRGEAEKGPLWVRMLLLQESRKIAEGMLLQEKDIGGGHRGAGRLRGGGGRQPPPPVFFTSGSPV